MYPVTQEFHEKMKATTRRIYAKVQIDYTDPFLDQSIQVQGNESANVSYPAQTADNIQEPIGKIASLDGTWVLGSDFVLAPGVNEVETHQMGWWGEQLAQADGTFVEPYPTLTATFFSKPIHSLKVVGDSARGEWPVDFIINLYDENNNILYTETVTENTEIEWSKSIEPVTQVTKMELIVTKWSHPGRQVKILEFFTSIQEVYEGDDIMLIHLIEEREVSQGSLPVGNISSNEIDIRLYNRNRKFDAGNKNSPLYGTLKANRRIKAWIGTRDEWVPLGTFWSGDWDIPEDDIYAGTTGRDRLELLRKSTYSNSQVQQDKTLYELAEMVLQDAGLTEEEYWIDAELQEYVVPYSYFESQSHREALRKIAEACLGQVYCDRDGVIRIEGPSYTENKAKQAIGTYFLEGAYPAETSTIEAYGIGADDYFTKNNPLKWSEIANYIEVETQPLKPDVEQEVYRSNDPVSINAGETKTITAFYNHTPCIDAVANIEGTGTITEATYYAWGATVKVTSSTTGTFTLVINAKPLKVLNKEKAIAQDEQSITDNGKLRYEFPKNPLVQTLDVAQRIADKLLQYYKDPRRDVSIEWRGNPALELGDIITVSDYQRNNVDSRGYYYITKQELEYDGSLRATLEGRRAL